MQRITADFIRKSLLLPDYRKAIDIYTHKGIELESLQADNISGKVFDGQWYQVSVSLAQKNVEYNCSCNKELPCAHCGALLFQALRLFRERDEKNETPSRELPVFSFWQSYFDTARAVKKIENSSRFTGNWVPVFSLDFTSQYTKIVPRYGYVRQDGSFGRWRYIHDPKENFSKMIKVNTLPQIFVLLHSYTEAGQNSFLLYNNSPVAGYLLDLMSSVPLFLENENIFSKPIFADKKREASVRFKLEKVKENIHITAGIEIDEEILPFTSEVILLSQFPVYLFIDEMLIKVNNVDRTDVLKPFIENPEEGIVIRGDELSSFWQKYFSGIPFKDDFIISGDLIGSKRTEITDKKLYITEDNNHLYFNLYFSYGDIDVKFSSRTAQIYNEKSGELIYIKRDWEEERSAIEKLLHFHLEAGKINGEFRLSRGTEPLEWLFSVLPEVAGEGFTILGEEKLKKFRINRNSPTIALKIFSEIDWFDLELDVKFGKEELGGDLFLNAVSDGRRYIELASGNKVRIPEEWLNRFTHLAKLLSTGEKKIRMNRYHLPLLEAGKDLFDTFDLDEKAKLFKEKYEKLDFYSEDVSIPECFKGELRPYQAEGFKWLNKLKEIGLGGILADDMGLGKTIQIIAFLCALKEREEISPALIVMPASLIFNWQKELKRFAPNLKSYILAGSERATTFTQIKDFDIILTTYGIIRRDWFWLNKQLFSLIVLDESQNIKNPLSQTFKSVIKLKSRFRLVLSGTPIENTTIDLWSQMSFLNPGLLGNLHWFRRTFAVPIERENDKQKLELLNRLIHPLVLRRKKEEVAGELPPKVEQVILCSMTEEQSKYYAGVTRDYRSRLSREMDSAGVNGIKLRIIEYLTRVRQICNHPKMIDPALEMDSGKMMTLMNLIRDITSEGYKVLVFSQFVKMLNLVRKELDDENILYQYLDGSTRNRENAVNEFQRNGEYQVFLISIKAGGLGLNLTAAEYVIQIDPWWNPAVEAQATDRAHRIGQDKKVFVYKLITHGTVEEKILKLQERKKKVSNNIVDSDAALIKSLDTEELLGLFSYEK
jgi:non-specific serine/threonine protein kinase